MGLLFGSAGAHTYLKSGQVAPPLRLVFFNVLGLDCKRFQTLPYSVLFERFSEVVRVTKDLIW